MQTADVVPSQADNFLSTQFPDVDALHEGLILDTASLHEAALSDLTGPSIAELRRLTTQITGRLDQLEAAGNA